MSNKRIKPNSTSNKENESNAEELTQVRYLDLARVLENGDTKRFLQLCQHVDLNEIQHNQKPFLFYAIERDDKLMIKSLLDQELKLDLKFAVEPQEDVVQDLPTGFQTENSMLGRRKSMFDNSMSSLNANRRRSVNVNLLPQQEVQGEKTKDKLNIPEYDAIEYAKLLGHNDLCDIIYAKSREPPLHERWIKVVDSRDKNEIKKFKDRLKSSTKMKELMQHGLIRASQKAYMGLIDYFLGNEKVNINCSAVIDGHKVTPLLEAIANKKNEAAQYLIYRGANIHVVGQYGDALVTAIHFDLPMDLVQLLLDKGASLTSRHKNWPALSLREYCVQFSKVKAKVLLDEHVSKLIANGCYNELKNLINNGYKHVNVKNHLKKFGRQIAVERHHTNIVELIDFIEQNENRLKIKMNYK